MTATAFLKLEHLQQAIDSAEFTHGHLRGALHAASATEALVILPLIERAAVLLREIRALNCAIQTDDPR